MATSQEQNPAILEEIMKELDNIVNPAITEKEQALTHGAIGNRTSHNLDLKYINEYSGHFITPGPEQVLETNGITKFDHQGTPPKGSMAGVAYAADGHQYIVAWSVPLQDPLLKPSLNKVYVEDGPDAPIDWSLIEKKLLESGDRSTSPCARAVITQGSIAKLVAVFTDKAPKN